MPVVPERGRDPGRDEDPALERLPRVAHKITYEPGHAARARRVELTLAGRAAPTRCSSSRSCASR